MHKSLIILIISILADVVSNNSIIQVFDIQTNYSSLLLTFVMLSLQMFSAPIQAGFSDFYCRKKSLVVALTFSLASLLLLLFIKSSSSISIIFLWTGLLLNACFGNIVPIAWSAIADTQAKNLRFFLALTTSAYAVGYMVLAILSEAAPHGSSSRTWLWQDIIMPLILLGLSILLIGKLYKDTKDRNFRNLGTHHQVRFSTLMRSEFSSLVREMLSNTTRCGILAYFCWAASQYSTLLFLVNAGSYSFTIVFMMLGYLIGVSILSFCNNISDEKIIRSAFVITIFSFIVFFIGMPISSNSLIILSISGFFYTMGNAFLTPSIFSLFSKERAIHEQGKGFGLIVSADSAGFLIGITIVKIFDYFKLDLKLIIFSSFTIFLISLIPYLVYEKTRVNNPRVE